MTSPHSQVRVSAIVPAAGQSRRMGRTKQTLRLGDSTMTAIVVATLLESGLDDVVVVTRSELVDQLELPLDECVTVEINDDTESEMIDSIRIGLDTCAHSATPPLGILVVPADMPQLTAASCRACLTAFAAEPTRIVIAIHRSRRGHPMIFPFSLRSDINALTGGLRGLAQIHASLVCEIAVDDPGTLLDIDTPDDVEDCID